MTNGHGALDFLERDTDRFYGKYRGTVSDNDDPMQIGRIRAQVPQVLEDVESGWAMPCAPYAGSNAGLYAIPPVGAGVWIEFEAGDTSLPIWSGAWWSPGDVPMDESSSPSQPSRKILRTDQGLIVSLDDDAQTITLSDSNGLNLMTVKVHGGVDRDQERRQGHPRGAADQPRRERPAPGRVRRPAPHLPEPARDDVQRPHASGRARRGLHPGHADDAGATLSAGDAEPDLDQEPRGVTEMATELTGGSTVFSDGENSMGAAIERQLNRLLTEPLPTDDTPEARDRRRVFAAIARGVIEHLAANPDALKVEITAAPGGHENEYTGQVVVQGTDIA